MEYTTKIQKLAPLQKQIQEKYADEDPTKKQLLAQLFQVAQVNKVARFLSALVQIPIFMSLYRALSNLVAENKLGEVFLWISALDGPMLYSRSAAEAGEWLKSIFSGKPLLGWPNTIAFLSLPLILYLSQWISQQLLQPAKDPSQPLSEQETMLQTIVNILPLIVAFFGINKPAVLTVYWIANNILTTLVTLAIKHYMKHDVLSAEVSKLMTSIEEAKSSKDAKSDNNNISQRREAQNEADSRPKEVGFVPPPRVEKEANTVKDRVTAMSSTTTSADSSDLSVESSSTAT